jgi:hypothetical protein
MGGGKDRTSKGRWRSWGVAGALVAVLLGAGLRLVWANDIEFKLDELWTFDRVQCAGRTEPFPWFGMPTSCGVRNPGLSVWVFLGFGQLANVEQAPDLARVCQLANVSALALLLAFALLAVPRAEQEPWLWTAALAAVNPLTVLLHRKIWPPAVVPLLTMVMLIGWWYRGRRWGAFGWGLTALLIGQIHPAGLFLAIAFALWALLFERQGVRWLAWLAGSVVGVVPLVPWLVQVARTMGTASLSQRQWVHVLEFKFWMQWVAQPCGFGLQFSLGKDFPDFLRYPLLGSQPTYLVAALHAALLIIAVGLLARGGYLLWQQRACWRDRLIGRDSPTAFTQNAALIGFGLVLTATLLPIQRQYVSITFPLMFLWLARLALARTPQQPGITGGRACLLGLCVAQLVISGCFLGYIHVNPRLIRGDYGRPYGALRAAGLWPYGSQRTPQDIENPLARAH